MQNPKFVCHRVYIVNVPLNQEYSTGWIFVFFFCRTLIHMSEGRCVIAKNFMIIYVENFSHLIIIFIKIVTDFFFFTSRWQF